MRGELAIALTGVCVWLGACDGEAAPASPDVLGGKGDGPGSVPDGCSSLTVAALDIWAQPLRAPSVRIGATVGTALGLCAGADFGVTVEAPLHHAFEGELAWRGGELTVTQSNAGQDSAWMLTHNGRAWTLWVGLAHRYFAASGPPARHGNDVRLLMDGQDAWSALAAEVKKAQRLVTGTSWWWTSDFELVRDAARHPTTTLLARKANTVIGVLEASPVEKKIMVGQFVGQDGLFSNLTVDDSLLAHAKKSGDRFEYMGEANPTAGDFTLSFPSVDFATRVDDAFAPNGDYAGDVGLAPFVESIAVGASDIPFVAGFELPIASWHQKFWTVDQKVAFIGGMNAKTTDWDTSAHRVFDPLRMKLTATSEQRRAVSEKRAEPDFGPRKDYMVRVAGPSVIDAVEVFHRRWERQRTGTNEYAAQATRFTLGETPAAVANGVQLQMIATMPAPLSENAILESLVRAVGEAKDFIYIEDQYFRAPLLNDAIVARMDAVPGLVLVVVTMPVDEWTDPGCWQTAIAYQRFRTRFPSRFRIYQLRTFDYVRTDCTFCQDETEAHFVAMDTHSKLVIVDDLFLEVGSCNSNNRGLLYEGELAVAVVDTPWVAAQRKRIFANLLGTPSGDIAPKDILKRLDAAATKNQDAWNRWDDEGMDIDLDGDALPTGWQPTGFLYPLTFNPPASCVLEDVGADAT